MSQTTADETADRRSTSRRRGLGVLLPGRNRRMQDKAASSFHRFDRPDSGTDIIDRVKLFHDADGGLFTCTIGKVPWIRLTLYQFPGSYLSLAMALRKADLRQVRPGIVLKCSLDATATRPVTTFARLNLRSPEQTETLYETIVMHRATHEIVFALDGVRLPFGEISDGWLDLIFSEPAMREIDIRSVEVLFSNAGAAHG